MCLIFSVFPAYGDTKTDTSETPFPTLAENIPASVNEFIDGNFSSITDIKIRSDEGYSKDIYYYNAWYDITSVNAVLSSEKGRVYVWKQTLSEYQ